jgi:alpha-tubulin suppressor-like RCC1 family protein
VGDGTTYNGWSPVPLAVVGGHSFQSITVRDYTACAATTTRTGYCWGDNYYGEAGNGILAGPALLEPTPVTGGVPFSSIGTDWQRSCGLASSGDIYCWGSNASGDFGDGTTTSSPIPVKTIRPGQ